MTVSFRASITVLLTFLTAWTLFGQNNEIIKRSLYSDVKAHEAGDVITVVIVEAANASRESKVNSSSQSDVKVDGSVTGNLTDFLPLFGAASSLASAHDGSEGTEQTDKLTGKISTMIVERTENGLLRIRGERVIDVNGETNLMRLEGVVRPRDIRTDNTVYSYNVANVRITYRKTGLSNKLLRPGAFHRWTTWAIGIGLLAVAVSGALW